MQQLKDTDKKLQAPKAVKPEKQSTVPQKNGVGDIHSSLGNQAVVRLYNSGRIQAKTLLGDSCDSLEKEADETANRVVSSVQEHDPGSAVRHIDKARSFQNRSTSSGALIYRNARPAFILKNTLSTHGLANKTTLSKKFSLPSGGRPLSHMERNFFEPRFGAPLDDVRLHTGARAADLAGSINAKAFTLGSDIVFGQNQYHPGSRDGKHLMAHELTHVLQQKQQAAGADTNTVYRENDDETAELGEELIPTAAIGFDDTSVIFTVPPEATFQPGPKLPQMVRIMLKALAKDQYKDSLVMPLVAILEKNKRKYVRTGHFRDTREAYKGEKINHIGFMVSPFMLVIRYLTQNNIKVEFTDDQLEKWQRAYSNTALWSEMKRVAREDGMPLPGWYNIYFFSWQMSSRSNLLEKFKNLLLEYEATGDSRVREQGKETAADIFYVLYDDIALLESIRKDASLYVNPETQLAYQAIWYLPEKQRNAGKPAVGLLSMKNAFNLVKVSQRHPDDARNSVTQRSARIALLKAFLEAGGIEDKTVRLLPPYPSYIVSPDLNPNHTTVTTASNNFRMFTKMPAVHSGSLLHQTIIAMAQTIYYSWKIYPFPKSLSYIRNNTDTNPDDLVTMSDEFVKNSPGNLTSPVKEYGPDDNYEQEVDMEDVAIGEYLLMGTAAPHYREDMRWLQTPSTAGYPFFVYDATTLATTTAYSEWDQLSSLEEQLDKAAPEDKKQIKQNIDLLRQRESSGLLALTRKDIEDSEKLLAASKKLKKFIQDDRQSNISVRGNTSTDPFIVRLKDFDPVLYDVYKMIRQVYSPREYDDIDAIDSYVEVLEKQIKDLERLKTRVSDARARFKDGAPVYRVVAALVKKDDGNVVPLLMVAGYHPDADPANGQYKIKLVDVTFDSPKKGDMIYVGDTKNNEKEAVESAFVQFGEDNKYGEGKIVYRLPQTSYKGTADSVTTFLEYLEYALAALGIIMLIAGTIATAGALSPAAVAVVTALGVSLAVVGASLAIRNMSKRSEKGTLDMDAETALDIVSIIGAVVVVVGTVSKVTLVTRTATLSRALTIQRLDRLIAIYDVTELGVNVYLINVKVQDDIKAIKELGLPKEQEDEMISAVTFEAIQQGAMMGVSAYSTFRQVPEIYQAKVNNSRYKSWVENGWIKRNQQGAMEITDAAPPFLRKLKSQTGTVTDQSRQGENARKAVVVETMEFTRTMDGEHRLTVTERGRIIRCSDLCADLRFKYQKILAQDPDLHQQLLKIELKAEKAAKAGNKSLAKEALAEAKALEGTLKWADEQWQRFTGAKDTEIDQALAEDIVVPEVTGGKKSGHKIEGRRVPGRQRRRLDISDLMSQKELVTEGGMRQALERLGNVMGKKISDIEVLSKHWEAAVASVLKGKAVTDYSRDTVNKKLYPQARRQFWKLVRKDPAAVNFLQQNGFEFKSKKGAPLAKLGPAGAENKQGKITNQERRISLDHIEEKAQGENWQKALDPDNLELMFQNANSEKENVQVRHKMRAAPPPPASTLNKQVLTPNERTLVSHGQIIGMLDIEIERFLGLWQRNPNVDVENMMRQMDQWAEPLRENAKSRSRLAPDIILDPSSRQKLPDFEQRIAGTGGIERITVIDDPYEGRRAVIIEGEVLPGRLTRRKNQVTGTRRRAPDFNRSSSLFTRKEAGLSKQWQRLHLWGPGFGDEAAAGMMWGPKDINLVWQNDSIESYIRQLSILTQRYGGSTKLKAKAISWEDPTPGGWPAPQGEHFLKRVEYEITLKRPDQPDTTIRITLDVAEPPSPKIDSFDIDPPHAINLGDLF